MTNSTGPRTTEGKAVVSRNAVRHGLLVQDVVTPRERIEDWEEFRTAITSALYPETALEAALADRVASLLWRLRRVPAAESDSIRRVTSGDEASERHRVENAERAKKILSPKNFYYDALTDTAPRLLGEPTFLPEHAALQAISRYEAHLNRQLVLTLHEIEALQERRKGNPAPLARLDVNGL